jgi:hypothetical protein
VLFAILVRAAFTIAEAPQQKKGPPASNHAHLTANTQVPDERLGGIKEPALRDNQFDHGPLGLPFNPTSEPYLFDLLGAAPRNR